MVDPTNPAAGLPPPSVLPSSEAESAKAWEAFVAHVARTRAKPTFDSEERNYKFEIAQRVRGFLDGLRDGVAALPAAANTLFDGSFAGHPYDLTYGTAWLGGWAANDPASLTEAVTRFPDRAHSPEARFDWFAHCAHQAQAVGKVVASETALLSYGSLFNFAVAPESAPVLRPMAFELLERILGYPTKAPNAPVAEKYEHHLAFTRWLEDRLRQEGVAVRDTVDVQSLVWLAALEHEFWFTPQPADELESMRARDTVLSRKGAYLSVCSIYRNEASYMREWVEFHRLMGVERFFLYDNASSDNHREVLAPYIEDGSVTVHDWSNFPLAQHQAYDHCLEEHRLESRWIAFIDLEQFLFSPTGKPLPEILADYEEWPAVCANLVPFGPCGHSSKPSGLVIENYARSVLPKHRAAITSIVDPVRVERCVSTHHFAYRHRTAADENRFPIWGPATKSPSYSILRTNHYWSKSEEECRAKSAMPRPDTGGFRPWPDISALRMRDEMVASHDDAILRYLAPLKQVLSKDRRPAQELIQPSGDSV